MKKRMSWLAACGLAGFGAARLASADRCRRVEAATAPLLAFTPQAAAAALLGSLLLRRRGPAAIAALTGIALAAVTAPRAIRRPQPRAEGPVLRVITANVLKGRASEQAIVRLVRRKGADVLFLQELTEPAVSRLKQAGLTDLLPHEITDLGSASARGRGIYARFPLTEGMDLCQPSESLPEYPGRPGEADPGSPALRPAGAAQLTAGLELPGGRRADLICVHASAPKPPRSSANAARWRRELAALPGPAGSAADPPRVLAGDFNASVDHVHFRRVLRRGHVDAAAQLGHGLVPTWGPEPQGRPALLTIDHVLVDPGCAVQAVSVHPLPGSDHRAVYAEFRLPLAGQRPVSRG
jgi:endonuclease/exonuclease/phosphatase family metal-dependent hydrolase